MTKYFKTKYLATSSSVAESGVLLPSYEVVSGSILRQLDHASSVESVSTDDEGEFYALLAMMAPAETVPDGYIIIVPLDPPLQDEALNIISGRKSMFVKVHDKLQTRNTYGHVASNSAGTANKPFPVGTLIKFVTPTNFSVTKHRLVIVIKDATGAEIYLQTPPQGQAVSVHANWKLGANWARTPPRNPNVRQLTCWISTV